MGVLQGNQLDITITYVETWCCGPELGMSSAGWTEAEGVKATDNSKGTKVCRERVVDEQSLNFTFHSSFHA